MKAGSKFLNAVSAVALSASVVASGAGVLVLASAPAAEAATIRSVQVRGAQRAGEEAVRSNLTIRPGVAFAASDIGLRQKLCDRHLWLRFGGFGLATRLRLRNYDFVAGFGGLMGSKNGPGSDIEGKQCEAGAQNSAKDFVEFERIHRGQTSLAR